MKIRAEFEVDADGRPQTYRHGRKHFGIRLYVESPPDDLCRLVYRLHETYQQPDRRVDQRVPRFEEEITSYGDFEVVTDLEFASGRKGRERIWLSTALQEHYRNGGMNPHIDAAIAEIKAS